MNSQNSIQYAAGLE